MMTVNPGYAGQPLVAEGLERTAFRAVEKQQLNRLPPGREFPGRMERP